MTSSASLLYIYNSSTYMVHTVEVKQKKVYKIKTIYILKRLKLRSSTISNRTNKRKGDQPEKFPDSTVVL